MLSDTQWGPEIAATLALGLSRSESDGIVLGGPRAQHGARNGGNGAIAQALLAPSIDDVVNPTARTFRAFAEQDEKRFEGFGGVRPPDSRSVPREDDRTYFCSTLVAVGTNDVIAGPRAYPGGYHTGIRSVRDRGRDHMKAVGDRSFKAAVVEFSGPDCIAGGSKKSPPVCARSSRPRKDRIWPQLREREGLAVIVRGEISQVETAERARAYYAPNATLTRRITLRGWRDRALRGWVEPASRALIAANKRKTCRHLSRYA